MSARKGLGDAHPTSYPVDVHPAQPQDFALTGASHSRGEVERSLHCAEEIIWNRAHERVEFFRLQEADAAVRRARAPLRWHPGSQLAAVDHGGVQVAGFLYDGLARVVGVINRGETSAGRLHGFDGHDLVAAYDPKGAAQWEAVWGPTGLIEHRDLVTATTALPVLDPLGSPVAVWQPATGTLAGALSWTPEGRATVHGPNGAVQCAPNGTGALCATPGGIEFGFAGQWQSATTGLVWMRARWYSPALAQFLSPDPLGFIDGPNRYAYAADDPVNRVDPLGLGSTGLAGGAPRGTGGRTTEANGLGTESRGTPPTASRLSIRPSYRGSWPQLAFQAAMMGFTVTGRNEQAGHNPGSRHFVGEAIDVRTAGKNNAEVADFMAFMRSQGYIVRDERVRPPGQAVWSGPHVHVETFDWTGLADALSPLRDVK